MLTGGVFSAVSVGEPSEEKEQTNEFAEDKQMVNEIDEETLEKARIALEDDKVREVLKKEQGFNERTIEKTSEALEDEQDDQEGEEYEPKVDIGKLISILEAAAKIYNTGEEVISTKNVDTWGDVEDSFVGAEVNDITINGWFNDVYRVEKFLPGWRYQRVEAWYHSTTITSADVYVDVDYVWKGKTYDVMGGEVPDGVGSALEGSCNRTVPSDDPSENDEGLRFWWTASGRITVDLGQHSGSVPDGGGGCPYITTWDGDRYTPENNILWQSNDKLGARDEMDVTDRYVLDGLPEKDGKYSIQLKELGNDISHIRDTEMIAIDKPEDTDVAVTQNGEVITYDGILNPTEIKTNIETNEANTLTTQNDQSIQVDSGDQITLDYTQTLKDSTGEKQPQILLGDISMKSQPTDIKVYTEDGWTKSRSFLPRSNGGNQAIDLSEYDKGNEIQKIKLEFNGKHKIDSIGLADLSNKSYDVQKLEQIHSNEKKVRELNDEGYVKLTPEDEGITLNYEIPEKRKGMERELMFVAEGFYNRHVPRENLTEGVQVRSRSDGVVYTPILESYEDAEHFLWRFNDGTISTDFRPHREPKERSYHKGTLTVIYKNGSVENFNID